MKVSRGDRKEARARAARGKLAACRGGARTVENLARLTQWGKRTVKNANAGLSYHAPEDVLRVMFIGQRNRLTPPGGVLIVQDDVSSVEGYTPGCLRIDKIDSRATVTILNVHGVTFGHVRVCRPSKHAAATGGAP